jgi:hypothetical protein
MSNKYKDNPLYSWTFDAGTNEVTKLEKDTGKVWKWISKPRPKGPRCNPSNGVTIEKLQKAGHSVRIKHFRWAMYLALNEHTSKKGRAFNFESHAICVPSTFRKDPLYRLLPKGGYTHIVIKPKSSVDKYICLSSECSKDDPFCYALGVEKALERLTSFELGYLGLEFHA